MSSCKQLESPDNKQLKNKGTLAEGHVRLPMARWTDAPKRIRKQQVASADKHRWAVKRHRFVRCAESDQGPSIRR
jgi:hypothetical protein